jgi:integrase
MKQKLPQNPRPGEKADPLAILRDALQLTDLNVLRILLEKRQETKMAGHIRAKGKCPICGKAFVEVTGLGFLCFEHKTIPERFYVDLPWKGERIRIFSDTTGQVLDSYSRAEKIRRRIESELEDHSFDPARYVTAEASKFYTSNLLRNFLKEKKKTIAPSYESHYTRIITIAGDFFKNQDVREIRKLDIVNFAAHCRESFIWKEKSVKNTVDIFKTFMNWLKEDLEVITAVPPFPVITPGDPPVKWVHAEDQAKLFDAVRDEDKPIVGFLMLHGCRPGEARALKCKDVDIENESITIGATFSGGKYREKRKGKRSRAVTIPIHPEMLGYLTDRIGGALPEAFVFANPRTGNPYTEGSLRRLWQRVRKALGLGKDLRLYDASRHSYASNLVNSGVSLFKVSKLLGHTSMKTTEKYAHADLEHLRLEIGKVSLKERPTVTRLSLKSTGDDEKP